MTHEWKKTVGYSALALLLGVASVLPVTSAQADDKYRNDDRAQGSTSADERDKGMARDYDQDKKDGRDMDRDKDTKDSPSASGAIRYPDTGSSSDTNVNASPNTTVAPDATVSPNINVSPSAPIEQPIQK